MKNRILLSLLIISAFALGGLSVKAWSKYKIDERIHAQAVQIQTDIVIRQTQQAEQARAKAEQAEKDRLIAECKAGLKAFDALPASQQKTSVRPVCDLQQVE